MVSLQQINKFALYRMGKVMNTKQMPNGFIYCINLYNFIAKKNSMCRRGMHIYRLLEGITAGSMCTKGVPEGTTSRT